VCMRRLHESGLNPDEVLTMMDIAVEIGVSYDTMRQIACGAYTPRGKRRFPAAFAKAGRSPLWTARQVVDWIDNV